MKINKLDTSKMMVVREYPKAKMYRNMAAVSSAINTGIGISNAKNHQFEHMMISYFCMFICTEVARAAHKTAKILQPEYNKIVSRAKQIYKHK